MPRTTGGPTHARKRKRVLRRAKGFVGGPGTIYRQALEFTRKAGVYAYRDRRQKKAALPITLGVALERRPSRTGRQLQPIYSRGGSRRD